MIGIRQNAVNAIGRKAGHLVLQREPSGLSPFGSCDDDQRPITEGCELGSLFEGVWQFGKLVALNAVEARRRDHGAFFVNGWDRQTRSDLGILNRCASRS